MSLFSQQKQQFKNLGKETKTTHVERWTSVQFWFKYFANVFICLSKITSINVNLILLHFFVTYYQYFLWFWPLFNLMNNGKLQLWSKAALKITHPWVNVIIFLSNWQRTEKIHNWCSWCRQLSKGPKSTEEQFKSAIDTEKNQRGHCWGIQKNLNSSFLLYFSRIHSNKNKKT